MFIVRLFSIEEHLLLGYFNLSKNHTKGTEKVSFRTFYLTEFLFIIGSLTTSVVISGTGFSSNFSENNVIIGGVECLVTDSTTSSITCDVGNGPVGSYPILVNVDGKGYATGSVDFTYTSDIASIDPPSGSLGGKETSSQLYYKIRASNFITQFVQLTLLQNLCSQRFFFKFVQQTLLQNSCSQFYYKISRKNNVSFIKISLLLRQSKPLVNHLAFTGQTFQSYA